MFSDVDGDEWPCYDEDEKSDGEYCTEGVHGVSFLCANGALIINKAIKFAWSARFSKIF